MNPGAYKVLLTVAQQGPFPIDQLALRSGEALSVVREVRERYGKWFVDEEHKDVWSVRASSDGFLALGHELAARIPTLEPSKLAAWHKSVAAKRPKIRRDLDQVWATSETVARRAERLIKEGEAQRGIAFLGDDDLCSTVCHRAGAKRTTTFEIDEQLSGFLKETADKEGYDAQVVTHDLRNEIPKKYRAKFGCVFTDPPYANEGFALFISRAVDLLKPDGRLWVCFGASRKASERGVAKQRILTEAGLFVEEVIPGFSRYEGAESIGGQSALWILSSTPQTRPLVSHSDGPLYTRRKPKR